MAHSSQTVSLIGLGLFLIGTLLRMYMIYRVRGIAGFSSMQMGDVRRYRELVEEGRAPFWPIPLCYFFGTVGFVVASGAPLLVKMMGGT